MITLSYCQWVKVQVIWRRDYLVTCDFNFRLYWILKWNEAICFPKWWNVGQFFLKNVPSVNMRTQMTSSFGVLTRDQQFKCHHLLFGQILKYNPAAATTSTSSSSWNNGLIIHLLCPNCGLGISYLVQKLQFYMMIVYSRFTIFNDSNR